MTSTTSAPACKAAQPSLLDKAVWFETVLADENLTSSEKIVAVRLGLYHNSKTGRCDPSLPTLAKAVGISHRMVQRALRALREAGYVSWNVGKLTRNHYQLERITIGQPKEKPAAVPRAAPAPVPAVDQDNAPASTMDTGDTGSAQTMDTGDVRTMDTGDVRPWTPVSIKLSSERSQVNSVSSADPSGGQTAASRSSTKTEAKPKFTDMPEGFALDERRTQVASRNGVNRAEVKAAWNHFVSHSRSKGHRSADWDAAWVSWCIRRSTMPKAAALRGVAV